MTGGVGRGWCGSACRAGSYASARLMGADCIISGIRPQIARPSCTLVCSSMLCRRQSWSMPSPSHCSVPDRLSAALQSKHDRSSGGSPRRGVDPRETEYLSCPAGYATLPELGREMIVSVPRPVANVQNKASWERYPCRKHSRPLSMVCVIRFGTCVGGSYKSRFPTVGRRC